MPIRKIYFVRHGERIDFIKTSDEFKEWLNDPKNNIHNPSLSKRGFKSAHDLGHYVEKQFLKKKDNSHKSLKIFSSPYRRCLETAISMMEGIKQEIMHKDEHVLSKTDTSFPLPYDFYIEGGLSEWFGEEKTWSTELLPHRLEELLQHEHFGQYLFHSYTQLVPSNDNQPPKVLYKSTICPSSFDFFIKENPKETVEDLEKRAKIALDNILDFCKEDDSEDVFVVIVSHAAGVIKGIEALLPEEKKKDVKAGTCGISELTLNDNNEWELTINSDVSFQDNDNQFYYWVFADYYRDVKGIEKI
ncbi:hypothetical protein ABK040_004115 [Willaertia magna]